MQTSTVVFIGAALVGLIYGIAPKLTPSPVHHAQGTPIEGCRVTDGDTIRCGRERIRLLGIDAPELPGHCAGNRHCAPGDPFASTDSLETAMTGDLSIERVGEDHYGRTLALVTGKRGDLSCWQLSHEQAIYKPQWDNGGKVASLCPSYAS